MVSILRDIKGGHILNKRTVCSKLFDTPKIKDLRLQQILESLTVTWSDHIHTRSPMLYVSSYSPHPPPHPPQTKKKR